MRAAHSGPRGELLQRGAVLGYVVALSATTTEGVLQLLYAPYLDAAGYALPLIGALTSLLSVTRLASRVPAGTGYRAERARRQVVLGLVALSVSTSAFAFGASAPLVVAVTVVHGFAFGSLGTVNLAATIDATAGRRAGATMAWYTAALSTGYTLGAFFGGALADRLGISAALLAAGAIPFAGVVAALAAPRIEGAPHPVERGAGLSGLLRAGRRIDQRVWLAFVIVLYVNVLSDAVDSFFPLYGLAMGLPLAAVGVLKALKSGAATVIRFASLAIFRWSDHAAVNLWGVVAMGVATFLIPLAGASTVALGVLFVVLGLCRGILRVTGAATVAEMRAEGKNVGLASGIYNSGLDIGATIGPSVGGIVASAIGFAAMYQVVALASLALYFALALSTAPGRASLRRGVSSPRSVSHRSA